MHKRGMAGRATRKGERGGWWPSAIRYKSKLGSEGLGAIASWRKCLIFPVPAANRTCYCAARHKCALQDLLKGRSSRSLVSFKDLACRKNAYGFGMPVLWSDQSDENVAVGPGQACDGMRRATGRCAIFTATDDI